MAILPAFGVTLLLYYIFNDLPDPQSLADNLWQPSIRVEDRQGRLLYESIDPDGGRNAPIPLTQIPLFLQQATILTEDKNFYSNPGVDLAGILRAFWINLQGKEIIAGGSTITQQLTRNLLLTEEQSQRTLRRKLRESWLAWRVARIYTKNDILEFYLNQSNYGGMAYGVEAAAQTYFGKSAATLTLAESALIAGLPQAPGAYNPLAHPEAAKERQTVVLGLMLKAGQISQSDYDLALREPLQFAAAPYPIRAPHFVMMALQEADSLLKTGRITDHQGIVVRTSLNWDWQQQAERIVAEQLARLARPLDGAPDRNAHNAALVALHPITGETLALVGNGDYFDAGNAGAVNMAIAPRQPGSAIKPFIYAAAFSPQVGTRLGVWNAATMIPDVRTVFLTAENEPYAPVNFSKDENGPVLARHALGSSLNIPAVAALDAVGLDNGLDFVQQMGIELSPDRERYGLSFALGGGEVRLTDLTAAFSVFANGGYRISPGIILEIRNASGALLYQSPPPKSERVLDKQAAWLISDILSDNEARMPAFGANSILRLDRTAAVKTGTTNSFHDNWTIGYTPDLAVGVWVGNANNEPMRGISGVSGAGPIWHHFMRAALADTPDKPFPQPDGLIQREICRLSGMLPSPDCPFVITEWFIPGTQPTQADNVYHRVWIDPDTGLLALPNSPAAQEHLALDLPPIFQDWAAAAGVPLLSDLKSQGDNAFVSDVVSLQFLSPDPNDLFFISPNLPRASQRIPIRVGYGVDLAQLDLFLDGQLIAQFDQPPYEYWWELSEGIHNLAATGTIANAGREEINVELSFSVSRPP